MADHHLGQRALSGAVLAHDRMHFASRDFKIHALQNWNILNASLKVLNR